jgi:hypothetical protein
MPTFGSRHTVSRVLSISSGFEMTAAVVSTGLSIAAYEGSCARKASLVASVKVAMPSPYWPIMSAVSAAAPPDEQYTATSSAVCGSCRASSQAVSTSSSMSSTSITPSWRIAALFTSADPVMDAVCEAAALAPYSERPTFSATIGLPRRAALRAASKKRCPSLKPSISATITLMSGASAM